MEGHSDLLIKPGGGRLPNKAKAMTVYVKKTQASGKHVLVLQKFDGVGSKDIIGHIRAPLKPPQRIEVVTQQTFATPPTWPLSCNQW